MSRLFLLFFSSILWTAVFGLGISKKGVSVTRTKNGSAIYAPGDLIFEDQFDTLDTSVWHHEININGGYNNEFQVYDKDPENSYVRDGILYIKPTLTLDKFGGDYEYLYNGYLKLEDCTDFDAATCEKQAAYPNILPPAYSARLRSKDSFSFTYGRVEVRAQVPSGDWTWPAIWFLPENDHYGGWPRSGEIDLMESRGNRKLIAPWGDNIGSEQVSSTLHFGPDPGTNGFMHAHGEINSAPDQGYDRAFHLYELEWTPEHFKVSVDGEVINLVEPTPEGGFYELGQFTAGVPNIWTGADNYRMAPFDQPFHFVLNVAVGGDFFPEGTTGANGNRPWPPGSNQAFLDFMNAQDAWTPSWSEENAAMKIDYIRVYAI